MKSERFIFRLKVKKRVWFFVCLSKSMFLFLKCAKLTSESANFQIGCRTCCNFPGPGRWWSLDFFACFQHLRYFSLFQEVIHPSTEASSDLCHYRVLLPIWRPIGLGSWLPKKQIKVFCSLIWGDLCQKNTKRLRKVVSSPATTIYLINVFLP